MACLKIQNEGSPGILDFTARSVQLEGKTGACYQHLETAKAHSGRGIWANRLRQLLLERMTKGTINMERNMYICIKTLNFWGS